MARYSACFNRAAASTTLAMGILQASATPRRIKLYQLVLGSEATAANTALIWTVDRVTADGSIAGGTAVTPNPLDPADAAALTTGLEGTITTNPTIGANLAQFPLNQQATLIWEAPPGGELVSPATDNNGFAIQTPTSTAIAVTATAFFQEQ